MSLKVWLPLDGDSRNNGTYELPVTTFNTLTYYDGKIGQCGQGILGWHLPEDILGNEWTIALWFNSPGAFNEYNNILFCKNIKGSTDGQIYFSIYSNNALNIGVNSSSNSLKYSYSFSVDTWYHVAATYDGTTVSLYLNGNFVASKVVTTAKPEGTVNMMIDARSGNETGTQWRGSYGKKYNDVRLYDHCLSAAEVKEIAQGLVLHYKLDGAFGGVGENLVINGDGRGNLNRYWSNWGQATDRKIIEQGNKKWLSFITNPNGNYGGFSQDRGLALYKPNTDYTISAIMYADSNVSGRLWVHTRSTEGGNNIGQYLTTVSVTNTPTLFTFTFNTKSNENYTINKVNLMIGAVNAASKIHFYITNIKIEEGKKATSWIPCKEELNIDTTIVTDSSGYGHNGKIIGDLILNNETSRYSYNTKWNSSSPTDNSETGICYIQTPFSLTTPLQLTVAWWAKPENGYGGGTGHAAFCTSNNASRPVDYNSTAFHHRDVGFDIYPSDGSGVKRLSFTYIKDEWHHYAITYDGTTAKSYRDGVLQTSVTVGTNKTLATFSQLYIGYSQAGGVRRKTLGSYSDFRIYCTSLLDTDIKLLYNVSSRIDNLGGIHSFELSENQSNIFRSELIMPTAKAGYTERIGEIVEHNGYYAMNIAPAPFYHNLPSELSGILQGQFLPNTSYIFDLWIDVDSVIFGGENRTGGLVIKFTDGTQDGSYSIIGGNKGWQHKKIITPSNKTIDRLEIYYYTSTDVFYRLDSYICPISSTKITKQGILDTTNITENSEIASIYKGGSIYSSKFIEM